MYGHPLSGPGAIAADSIARPRLAACSQSTGRQRADGRRPRGDNSSTMPRDPTEAYWSHELSQTAPAAAAGGGPSAAPVATARKTVAKPISRPAPSATRGMSVETIEAATGPARVGMWRLALVSQRN